ncbi:MAG TPA: paraquat-inducible membrane protein A [Rhodobacterales bacterium]|nr:paraquat-inducible membrane protein A [Rhodobacterales bacterium]
MRNSLFSTVGPFGKLLALSNIAILVLLPISWLLPLLRSSAYIGLSEEISILRGAWQLLNSDLFLFVVLVAFAMVMPFVKTVIYTFVWFAAARARPRIMAFGAIAAKLSMTDVFLIAITIIGIKGLSVGQIEPH